MVAWGLLFSWHREHSTRLYVSAALSYRKGSDQNMLYRWVNINYLIHACTDWVDFSWLIDSRNEIAKWFHWHEFNLIVFQNTNIHMKPKYCTSRVNHLTELIRYQRKSAWDSSWNQKSKILYPSQGFIDVDNFSRLLWATIVATVRPRSYLIRTRWPFRNICATLFVHSSPHSGPILCKAPVIHNDFS